MKKRIFVLLGEVLILVLFFMALRGVERTSGEKGREHLEIALRQAAVACYASEGIYPPNINYLREHYGIQVDEKRYFVDYEVFANNLMPSITVLERES